MNHGITHGSEIILIHVVIVFSYYATDSTHKLSNQLVFDRMREDTHDIIHYYLTYLGLLDFPRSSEINKYFRFISYQKRPEKILSGSLLLRSMNILHY